MSASRRSIFGFARFALLLGALLLSLGARAELSTLSLVAGWNLLGNSNSAPIAVAQSFGDPGKVVSVWKWNRAQGKWAFYSPSMSAQDLAAYAQARGYDVLSSIASREGFWVRATQAHSAIGAELAPATLLGSDLAVGWNLVADGGLRATPAALGQALCTSGQAAGTSLATLWAWNAATSKWKFYAPSLDAQGGTVLADYIAGKPAYVAFAGGPAPGEGFWANALTAGPGGVPAVLGVVSGATYVNPVTPSWAVNVPGILFSASLNGQPFASGTEISLPDQYELVVTATRACDNVSSLASVQFTVGFGTPPKTTKGPLASTTTATSVTLEVEIDENGKGYFLRLPAGSVAPKAIDIRDASPKINLNLQAGVSGFVTFSGLTAATSYNIYFVAEDAFANLQSDGAVTSVTVTTSN